MSERRAPRPHGIVLGVGPGIGAAVARRLAREHWHVTLVARSAERLDRIATELERDGATVDVHALDIADLPALRALLTGVVAASGAPAFVVYNAAMLVPTRVLSVEIGELLTGFAVDVAGAIVTAQSVVPAMVVAGSGTFILTGGRAATQPSPGIATVSMGKAALRSMASMLAAEVSEDGVQVVDVSVNGAVSPGSSFDAEFYWRLHGRANDDWTVDVQYDGVLRREVTS